MRDYGLLIEQLRESNPEAAEAMSELLGLARKMTTLGVDLEAQIQDDMSPDYYAVLNEDHSGMFLLVKPEILRGLPLPFQLPLKWTALKVIGDSWFVRFNENEEIQEFFERSALDQAVEAHKQEMD